MLEGLGPDGAADVVDEDVDAAEALHGLGHHALGVGVALQVGGQRQQPIGSTREAAQFMDQLGAVHRGHPAALFQQPLDDAPADALCRAGDDGDLVVETWFMCGPQALARTFRGGNWPA